MDVIEILKGAVSHGASDIFIVAGLPVCYKVSGNIVKTNDERLMPQQTEELVKGIYELAENRDFNDLRRTGDDDFSFSIPSISRFRANTYRQRSSIAAVIRIITFELASPDSLGIPPHVLNFSDFPKGLVLVTGPAGSGKSTTLACMIDRINKTRSAHVITLEDPIEYLHRHDKSIVSQRELITDTQSYVTALRAALRQSPDVILLGEMRDYETINVAMTAAETGHLVLSTLHTVGVANTIDRIIDAFPPNQQHQIRAQLSMVLQAVVSQQLVSTIDGGVVPAFEIMTANSAIRNLIRESKIYQIESTIFSSANEGMVSMDGSLLDLFKKGVISDKEAISYSTNPEIMKKKMAMR